MLNSILALLLIIVGFLPVSNTRTSLETKLKEKVMPRSEVVEVKEGTAKIAQVPEKNDLYNQISSGSAAALFVDADSGEILFEKNKDKKLPMASTTKLMTALIALENAKPEDVVTIPSLNILPLDTTMGLSSGDKLTVRELIHGLLIESGADAAQALAVHVGGNEQHFVAMMNERATKLGLSDTQFTNSIGHDTVGHFSTTTDLVKLGRIALTNPLIAEVVAKKTYTATAVNGKKYYLSNTNKLLGQVGYMGLKTGTTFEAGECLVTYYNDGGRKIIGVVLGSPDRFGETRSIIEWTKSNFAW